MILIGRNDADALATGWHPLQDGPGGVPCRWMSPRAEVRMPKPHPGAGALCVSVSAPDRIRRYPPGLSLYYGEEFLGNCADLGDEGFWTTALIPINPDRIQVIYQDTPNVTLTLAVENRSQKVVPLAFIPHEVLNNGDLRELGVQISSLRWVP